jgi:hypothetical protein
MTLGVAAFADWGGAWYDGSPQRTGKDWGAGIRLGGMRPHPEGATRIDVARRYANDAVTSQWVLSSGADSRSTASSSERCGWCSLARSDDHGGIYRRPPQRRRGRPRLLVESTAAVVSTVRIERENVRPGGGFVVAARVANARIVTREHVVARAAHSGGAPFDSATADETARNPELGIFRKVTVDSSSSGSGLIEDVATYDSWTTGAGELQVERRSDHMERWARRKNLLGRHIKASVNTRAIRIARPRSSRQAFRACGATAWGSPGVQAVLGWEAADFTASAPFRPSPRRGRRHSTWTTGPGGAAVLRGREEASDTLRHLMTRGR